VGQPDLGVQEGHRRLGVGADLTGRSTQGVGGLEWVPPLGPSATVATMTDVDGELTDQRLTRDLGLELFGCPGLNEGTAAVRAGVGSGAW